MKDEINSLKRYTPNIEGEQHDDPHAEMCEDDLGEYVKLSDVIRLLVPEQLFDEELVEFAKWFSENYSQLEPGKYVSDNKNYTIEYFEDSFYSKTFDASTKKEVGARIDDGDGAAKTFARISKQSKIIQVSKARLLGYPQIIKPDFVFALVLWCAAKGKLGFGEIPDWVVDEKVFKFCVSQGRSRKQMFDGWYIQLEQSPTEHNKERIQKLSKLLHK